MSEGSGGVATIIVNYRTPQLALRCVQALEAERSRVPGLEAVVVDGGSNDGSADILKSALGAPLRRDWLSLLPLDFNGGFGWANNQAMLGLLQREDPPEFIHLLNPDAIVTPGAIDRLLEAMAQNPRCGAAGSQLVDEDGSPGGSAFRFPSAAREFVRGANTPALGRLLGVTPMLIDGDGRDADWVTGASVMLRASALREAGLFDDGFFLYFEDVELMRRLKRAGWSILHVPESRVVHIGGASTGVDSEGAEAQKRLPAYWHEARRRYFARANGPAAAILASLFWLFGRVIWSVRSAIGLGRGRGTAPSEARDMLKYGFWPSPCDRRPAVVDWRSPPGLPPAWSANRDRA